MDKIYNVKIANMELQIYSGETKEYTETVAAEVDDKIKEIMGDNLSISVVTAALLAAMDFCDELNKYRQGADNMRIQLKAYMDEAGKASAERDEARRLADKFKNDLLALKIDMSNQKKDN